MGQSSVHSRKSVYDSEHHTYKAVLEPDTINRDVSNVRCVHGPCDPVSSVMHTWDSAIATMKGTSARLR